MTSIVIIGFIWMTSLISEVFPRSSKFRCQPHATTKRKSVKCNGCNCAVHCDVTGYLPARPDLIRITCIDPWWKEKSKRMCMGRRKLRRICRNPKTCPYKTDEDVKKLEKEVAWMDDNVRRHNFNATVEKPLRCKRRNICARHTLETGKEIYKYSCTQIKDCNLECISIRYFRRKCDQYLKSLLTIIP